MEKFVVIRQDGATSRITCKGVTVDQIKTCHELFKKQDKEQVTYIINDKGIIEQTK
jgi:hypothetical protein